jgi:23S rRNA (guanosine2251-2'-O)-methyltransferase
LSERPRSGIPPQPFVIGGRRPVLEAVRAGRARRVVAAFGAKENESLRALTDEATRQGVRIERVDREAIDILGLHNHQGVAAFVSPLPEIDERALASMELSDDAVAVFLDGITDPQNYGACARSAEAAGAAVMVVRKKRAAPLTPAAVKASAGALLHLPVARVANLTQALGRLKERGFFVVGLDERASTGIDSDPPPRPVVMVVGSEGFGLSRLVAESCDLLVSIPMGGKTGSLNASAALAVGLFGYLLRPPG